MEHPPFPTPPYPLRPGLSWEMNKDCVFVFDHGEPVMAISIAEIMSEVAKQTQLRASSNARSTKNTSNTATEQGEF